MKEEGKKEEVCYGLVGSKLLSRLCQACMGECG
jgi:hypothetical protein